MNAGAVSSSSVDKTTSFHSTRENTPLNEVTDEAQLNGTNPQLQGGDNSGNQEMEASADH